MKLNEYQELSKRTMPYNGEPANQVEFENMLGNYAMGLVGEWFEFSAALVREDLEAAVKEVGDILHYIVGLLSCIGERVDFGLIYELDTDEKTMVVAMGDILEMPKKHIYHRHELDKAKYKKAVHAILKMLMTDLGKDDLSKVMQANIDKLKTRYPEQFSVEDSIKRVDTHEH